MRVRARELYVLKRPRVISFKLTNYSVSMLVFVKRGSLVLGPHLDLLQLRQITHLKRPV